MKRSSLLYELVLVACERLMVLLMVFR